MIFKVGDRIYAREGVCPGSYGIVTRIKNEDVVAVVYDGGRKDHIPTRMIDLVERDTIDYDMD